MSSAILSVDPGSSSGWAIYAMNESKPIFWGQVALKTGASHSKKSAVALKEILDKAVSRYVSLMVIEGPYKIHVPKPKGERRGRFKLEEAKDEIGWRTYHSMGQSFGRWVQVALERGLRIVEVNPRSWQAATVGTGRRQQQIPKYQDLAKHLTGQSVPADAAAAIVIGYYWRVKGEHEARLEEATSKHEV